LLILQKKEEIMAKVRAGLRIPINYEYDHIVEEVPNYGFRGCCESTVERVKYIRDHFSYDELLLDVEVVGYNYLGDGIVLHRLIVKHSRKPCLIEYLMAETKGGNYGKC
jgi:hypothetical protein